MAGQQRTERLTIKPVAVRTWDELVMASDVARPGGGRQRAIPFLQTEVEPIGLEELGTSRPGARSEHTGRPGSRLTSRAIPDLTAVAAPPTASFEALPDNNTVIPPDTHGAAGPAHLMTMLNSQVRIQNKSGGIVSTTSLDAFWSLLTGDPFDPRIHYDPLSSRWISICAANSGTDSSEVYFAISDGSDPTGAWSFYAIDADPVVDGPWADYPTVGFNEKWIAITANMFSTGGSFVGPKMWVIDKSTALAGGTITLTVFSTGFDASLGGGIQGSTLQPCICYNASDELYLVDNTPYYDTSDTTFLLRLSRITGTASTPSWSVVPGSDYGATGLFSVLNNFNSTQIDAPQLGSGTDIETNDKRMQNAVYRNGRVWSTHSAGLPAKISPSPNRTAAFWYELNPGDMPVPVVQSGLFDGGAGVHYTFPSIAANSVNDALIGFTRVDASRYAEAVFSGRLGGDAPGVMTPISLIKAGESDYTKFFSGSRNRWGDYSNTCVDPSDNLTLWTIQEYAAEKVGTGTNSGRWGTWWAKVDPATALPITLGSFSGEVLTDGAVRLVWMTHSETGNFGFEVERSDDDRQTFSMIPGSFIEGGGTTLESRTYSFVDHMVPAVGAWYRLRQIDLDGTVHRSDAIRVEVLTSTEDAPLPEEFALLQNHPNPFNPSTTIEFDLPLTGWVSLKVYNNLGGEIATLVEGELGPGRHLAIWNPEGVASGVYFYRMLARPLVGSQANFGRNRQLGGFAAVRKLVLVR